MDSVALKIALKFDDTATFEKILREEPELRDDCNVEKLAQKIIDSKAYGILDLLYNKITSNHYKGGIISTVEHGDPIFGLRTSFSWAVIDRLLREYPENLPKDVYQVLRETEQLERFL